MTLDDVMRGAKKTSHESSPKKYSMFIASKPVNGDRKWLDVTNKYTNDVGKFFLFFCNLNHEIAILAGRFSLQFKPVP